MFKNKSHKSWFHQDHVTRYAKDAGLSLQVIAIPEFEGPDEVAMENFLLYCNQIRKHREVVYFSSSIALSESA